MHKRTLLLRKITEAIFAAWCLRSLLRPSENRADQPVHCTLMQVEALPDAKLRAACVAPLTGAVYKASRFILSLCELLVV